MKFLLMVYTDPKLMDALPEGEFDRMMRGCLHKADELRASGTLLDAQQLEAPVTAKSLRARNGSTTIFDGPFAEAKEVFAGFNLIEAADIDEALRDRPFVPVDRASARSKCDRCATWKRYASA